ncbi:hypothetical protein Bhyg_03478, partial [Pseudolycoriella hygida]
FAAFAANFPIDISGFDVVRSEFLEIYDDLEDLDFEPDIHDEDILLNADDENEAKMEDQDYWIQK